MHNLDRLSVVLGDLEVAVTLALNAKSAIVQLLRGKMREYICQICCKGLILALPSQGA